MQHAYQQVVGWVLALLFLSLIAKSRTGYVIIYYILLLSIFLIVVVEYRTLTPLLKITSING